MPLLIDRAERDQFIQSLTNHFETLTGDKKTSGWLIVTIHVGMFLLIMYQVFLRDSKIEVLMGAVWWLFILGTQPVFGGCGAVRVERLLLEDENWANIWCLALEPAKYIGYPLSKEAFFYLQCFTGLLLTTAVLWRVYIVLSRKDEEEK
tara:strand:+ start:2288 stop:2734 length:447 start_codon:yes stop_codon:yes gene_type:complete